MISKRFYGSALIGAILVPVALTACSDDATNPLCCNEFKAGATINADIGGSVQSQIAVQAVSDFAGIASAAVSDITSACQRIAADLDVSVETINEADKEVDLNTKMSKMCQLAVTAIGTAKGSATLTIDFQPPVCNASISAKASCQAKCDVSAPKCDFKANPPKCTGKLEVACKGDCTASGSASVACTGSCEGNCTGSCTAEGGVQCAGECDGTCEGNTANGAATGKCEGTCKGTCSATAPNVKCEGSCQGSCSATCKGSAEASVKCDGSCTGEIEPLRCEGGELSGGCTPPDAKCEGSCDASVKAKAECTPPALAITFSAQGSANVNALGKLKATLEANMGVVLAFKERLKIMGSVVGSFTANVTAVTDIKVACIPPVAAAIAAAGQQVTAAGSESVKLAGSIGVN